MHEIISNVRLEMENVLSYRARATQAQLTQVSKDIAEMLKANGAKAVGPTVTATFAMDASGAEPVMDIEILVPLDKEISVTPPYAIKPLFRLTNALRIRHKGDPALLKDTADELMEYVKANSLTPITAGYNVTVQEPAAPEDIKDLIIDIYLGVTENIL